MKTTLHVLLCVLISLALTAFGVLYGINHGFSEERAEVEALLWSENGLGTAIAYRGADGLNLYAVAKRYLPEDDMHMRSLKNSGQELAFHSEGDDPYHLFIKDEKLWQEALMIQNDLQSNTDFRINDRDPRYVDMLLADMNSLSSGAAITTYNRHAAEFNAALDTPLGRLAQRMGIRPIELYE